MNRRELAKNGLLGLCGVLLAPFLKDKPFVYEGGTDPNLAAGFTVTCSGGQPVQSGSYMVFMYDGDGTLVATHEMEWEDGYTLQDGQEIDHG